VTKPSIPFPKVDQLVPFHWAMPLKPLVVALHGASLQTLKKKPPAYTVLPETASDSTVRSSPFPNGDQIVPFHWAMPLKPAVVVLHVAFVQSFVNPPPA